MQTITQNFTDNGESDVIDWHGQFRCHFAVGDDAGDTFGGGTATLRYSLDGGESYRDATDAAFTATGDKTLMLPQCKLKIVLSGATSPDLNAFVRPVSAG